MAKDNVTTTGGITTRDCTISTRQVFLDRDRKPEEKAGKADAGKAEPSGKDKKPGKG